MERESYVISSNEDGYLLGVITPSGDFYEYIDACAFDDVEKLRQWEADFDAVRVD